MKQKLFLVAVVLAMAVASLSYQWQCKPETAAVFSDQNSQGLANIHFLNDRAANIIGSSALAAPGFVTPLGLTGEGQVVGLADSGLDKGFIEDIHPDLKSTPGKKPRVIMLKSWAGRDNASDPVGHGTHMAATIAGSGAASGGKFKGVAPGASIYFQGVLDNDNKVALPAKLEDLFRPAYAAGARIHVDAWGTNNGSYNTNAASIDQYIKDHPDFTVVLGAGNSGSKAGTLTAEANSKNALVVGASVSPRPALDGAGPDTLERAAFSSRGPTADGRIKPELLAPGTSIVSARADGVEGNMPGYPQYARMQGTSMAAAVTGGSVAVLRQFFNEKMNIPDPSAALIKASLVNGARTGSGGPTRENFGVLDMAATVLALKTGAFQYSPGDEPLAQGKSFSTYYDAQDAARPLKISLAWTDPVISGQGGSGAAGMESGSLVNRLHLEVTAPDGRVIYGNNFLGGVGPDGINNVQQVYIKAPAKGQYKVAVVADHIDGTATPWGQAFALVYGQPLQTGVIAGLGGNGQPGQLTDGSLSSTGSNIYTAGEGQLNTEGKDIYLEINGALVRGKLEVYKDSLRGAQYYADARSIYISACTWLSPGVQLKKSGSGYLWSETATLSQEGGFYQADSVKVMVNGKVLDQGGITNIPPGISARININPITGKLWQVVSDYRLKEGTVLYVTGDADHTKVVLSGDSSEYSLPPGASWINADRLEDADPLEAAFGTVNMGDKEAILPGMHVRLVLDRYKNIINAVIDDRPMVAGVVSLIDREKGKILLDNGKYYDIFPGVTVYRQDNLSAKENIVNGDYLFGLKLSGYDTLLALAAYPRVEFGRIVYINNSNSTITIYGANNVFSTLALAPGVSVTRWGQAGQLSALGTDDWVRLIMSEDGKTVNYIAVADRMEPVEGTVQTPGPDKKLQVSGQTFMTGGKTLYTREKIPVSSQDILPGDDVVVTPLVTSRGVVAAEMAAANRPGAKMPSIKYTAISLNKLYLISGVTDAGKIYVNRGSGDMVTLLPNAKGEFTYSFEPSDQQESIVLVAVNPTTGVATSQQITVPSRSSRQFSDITGHWAEQVLARMAGRGLIVGYPDGTFRPDRPVTREELAVMVARCFGWTDPAGLRLLFSDRLQISGWAYSSVAALWQRDIMKGYNGGTFGPGGQVSRSELAVTMASLLNALGIKADQAVPAFTDLSSIPAWARSAVEQVSTGGVLVGQPGNIFAPKELNTRAQAAVVLYRLLQVKEQQ